MGSNVGSAISVYLWTFIFSRFGGLKGGMLAVGVIIMVFAVITFFIFRDVPEQMGLTPDNMPMTEEEIAASRAKFEEKEKITYWRTFKTAQFLGRCSIIWCYGYGLCRSGISDGNRTDTGRY